MLVLTQGLRFRPRAAALRATRPAAMSTLGLLVLVHEVMAAMHDVAVAQRQLLPAELELDLLVTAGLAVGLAEVDVPRGLHVAEEDAVLRAGRAGEAGLHRAHVELEDLGVPDGQAVVAPQALQFGVGLDGGDVTGVAARRLEVLRASGRRWGRSRRWRRTRGPCWRWWRGSRRSCRRGRGRRTRRTSRRRPSCAGSA
jgi:hypothetical protein